METIVREIAIAAYRLVYHVPVQLTASVVSITTSSIKPNVWQSPDAPTAVIYSVEAASPVADLNGRSNPPQSAPTNATLQPSN